MRSSYFYVWVLVRWSFDFICRTWSQGHTLIAASLWSQTLFPFPSTLTCNVYFASLMELRSSSTYSDHFSSILHLFSCQVRQIYWVPLFQWSLHYKLCSYRRLESTIRAPIHGALSHSLVLWTFSQLEFCLVWPCLPLLGCKWWLVVKTTLRNRYGGLYASLPYELFAQRIVLGCFFVWIQLKTFQ